jgi:hypothetical protein
MQGMLSNLPPGMAGFVLADQQRGQKTAQNIQSLGLLSQLQNADLERQLTPLKVEQLKLAVQKAKQNADLMTQLSGGILGGPSTPGAVGATSAGGTPTAGGRSMLNAPGMVQAMLLSGDAGMSKYAQAFLDQNKPLAAREGAPVINPATGEVVFFAPKLESGMVPNYTGGQLTGVTNAPGYIPSMTERARAQEGVKAQHDLVTVPPTSPNAPPTFRSRAQVLQDAGAAPAPTPVTTTAPTDAEALRIVQEASRNGGHATVTVPSANAPTAPIPSSAVLGNAAGISPAQEADVKATAAFKLKTAEDYSKLYGELNNSSMRLPPKIAKFERVGQLLGELEGGKLSPAGFELARLGNSLGLKLDPNLSNKEAAAALSNEIALELRGTGEGGGMPGALSDADREFLKSMTPQMASTAEGRKQIIQSRTSVWRREIDVAGMARKYVKKYGRLDEDFFSQLSEWSSRNPIFK